MVVFLFLDWSNCNSICREMESLINEHPMKIWRRKKMKTLVNDGGISTRNLQTINNGLQLIY